MNEPLPAYQPLKKPDTVDPVARSIAKPNAFAKPGTMAKPGSTSTRMRPLTVKRGPGRMRKRKLDPRHVTFF